MGRWNTDLAGRHVGKLTVISVSKPAINNAGPTWLCLCDCGNYTKRKYSSLTRKKTPSCGCNRLEVAKQRKASWRAQYNSYRRCAEQRSLEFQLTFDEFCDITSQNCIYCGDEPKDIHTSSRQSHVGNGIDRVINSIGYTRDNSVPCCRSCNLMKHVQTKEDFLARCKRIAQRYNELRQLAA